MDNLNDIPKISRVKRRELERNKVKKKATYTYTLEELNKLLDDKVEEQNKIQSEVTSKIINERVQSAKIEIGQRVTDVTLGIVIGVLHHDFKFGKKRLDRLFDEVKDQIKAFNEKRITLGQIASIVNKIGIEDVISNNHLGGEEQNEQNDF